MSPSSNLALAVVLLLLTVPALGTPKPAANALAYLATKNDILLFRGLLAR